MGENRRYLLIPLNGRKLVSVSLSYYPYPTYVLSMSKSVSHSCLTHVFPVSIRVLPISYLCLTHVLHVCYTSSIRVLPMFYPHLIHVLSMSYPCLVHILPVSYPCPTCVLPMFPLVSYPCPTRVLPISYPCLIFVQPVSYPCPTRVLHIVVAQRNTQQLKIWGFSGFALVALMASLCLNRLVD